MPKERFHLLLANRYWHSRDGRVPDPVADNRLAFFLGAVSPDIFFYDLPFFSLSPLGDSLHTLTERSGVEPIRAWLAATPHPAPQEAFAWAMGFACHVLADNIWHPAINGSIEACELCGENALSAIDCHRLLESELEAHWLGKEKTPGGYDEALKTLAADRGLLRRTASFYRRFLASSGLAPPPGENSIRRCFRTQNLLLRLFAKPLLGRRRDMLLAFRQTRCLGSLAVPANPVLASSRQIKTAPSQNPFEADFMEEGLTSLTARLSELAERLAPFLPN